MNDEHVCRRKTRTRIRTKAVEAMIRSSTTLSPLPTRARSRIITTGRKSNH